MKQILIILETIIVQVFLKYLFILTVLSLLAVLGLSIAAVSRGNRSLCCASFLLRWLLAEHGFKARGLQFLLCVGSVAGACGFQSSVLVEQA